MSKSVTRSGLAAGGQARSVTIKDLAIELGLSITTISRALNGYSDVGEKTRRKVADAAERLGYRPNRNAQRLVTRRTHNIAWVQPDNERKFLDPHFVEVMAGVLLSARHAHYDIVMTSETPEHELEVYDRYVKDNSVDGFIIDLPRNGDPRVDFLLERGRPFVVHGREDRCDQYGWVDVDNYGNFYRLTRFLVANGHTRLAFVNGDERFNYALFRRQAVEDALADAGLPADSLSVFNALHPMGDAGYRLTLEALSDPLLTGIVYSSALLAMEGNAAIEQSGRPPDSIAVATMDDELHYLDITRIAHRVSFVRSSLRAAGIAIIEELARQCDKGTAPQGTIIASTFIAAPGFDPAPYHAPLPANRQSFRG